MVGPYIYRPTAVQLGPPAIVHQLLTETATYHSSDKTVRVSAATLCYLVRSINPRPAGPSPAPALCWGAVAHPPPHLFR